MDTDVNKTGLATKSFSCKDVGASCDWSTTGKTEDEVLMNVQKHVEDEHKDMKFTDDEKEKVRSSIKTVDPGSQAA